MPESLVPQHLIAAYKAADYRVDGGSAPFRFRVQQYSADLARLLAEAGKSSGFFITAHNPFSQPQSEAANRAAHERLRRKLAALTAHLYEAAGEDKTGEWPVELGYVALGVRREDAQAVGQEFRQNAIVWIGADARPELMLLR